MSISQTYQKSKSFKLRAVSEIAKVDSSFSKSGYTFVNWLGSDGNTYSDQANVKFYGNTFDLTAQWAKNIVYTVTFNSNGGTCNTTTKLVESGKEIGELPTCTKEGEIFLGWFTTETGSIQINTSTTITSNVTYYAQYMSNIFLFKKYNDVVIQKGSDLGFTQYSDDIIVSNFTNAYRPYDQYTIQNSQGVIDPNHTNNCLISTKKFNFANALEIVFLAKTGSDVTSNQEVFSGCSRDHNEFGVNANYFMWEIDTGFVGSHGPKRAQPNTWYWFKVIKSSKENSFTCYVADPDNNGNESTYIFDHQGTRKSSVNEYVAIGIDAAVGVNEQWRGYINLSKSYFKINGTKIPLGIQED